LLAEAQRSSAEAPEQMLPARHDVVDSSSREIGGRVPRDTEIGADELLPRQRLSKVVSGEPYGVALRHAA